MANNFHEFNSQAHMVSATAFRKQCIPSQLQLHSPIVSRIKLCCEVKLRNGCEQHRDSVCIAINSWLSASSLTVTLGKHDPKCLDIPLVAKTCSSILIECAIPEVNQQISNLQECQQAFFSGAKSRSSLEHKPSVLPLCQVEITTLTYYFHGHGPIQQAAELEDEDVSSCFEQWELPNQTFEDLWESLHFETSIKTCLLRYAFTSLLFSSRRVNSQLIRWNRLVLLHGPPGSGKTSLCKGLAQKLSIRLSRQFSRTRLVELKSANMYTRWFGESSKRVSHVFSFVRELLEDSECLVILLIDEVETLSGARSTAATNEPSDALRVVNSLLTQIDSLSVYPNVLVVTTSNLTEMCDRAFIDRADLKQYIPSPNWRSRYIILSECLQALRLQSNSGLLGTVDNPPFCPVEDGCTLKESEEAALLHIAKQCEGMSGRTLRKIPFLAYGKFSEHTTERYEHLSCVPSSKDFLEALLQTVNIEKESEASVAKGSKEYA